MLLLLLFGGICADGLLTIVLVFGQQHQRHELIQERKEFCRAEYELRAKITEIEIEIHSYIYVPPSPICR